MRVLFITRKFPPSVGGMETYSHELFAALREISSDVDIHKPRYPINGRPSLARLAAFFLGASWALIRNRRAYEAVLIGDFAIAGLAPVAKIVSSGKTRVVVSLHGNDLYFLKRKGIKARIYHLVARVVIRSNAIDAGVANSQAIKKAADSIGIRGVRVVTLGTSVPRHDSEVPIQNAILFAGRLIKYKGLSWFVREVWPNLDPAMELLVAGTVWDKQEYACIKSRSRIRYLGSLSRDELSALRSQVMACIMPNLPPGAQEQDEGFGLSALEGPAVGTPTVAARCGGLVDAIANGITGFLLPPLDSREWVRCLNEISGWSRATREDFANKAREYVMEHYNWRRVAEQTLQVLKGNDKPGAEATGNRTQTSSPAEGQEPR